MINELNQRGRRSRSKNSAPGSSTATIRMEKIKVMTTELA